MINATRDQLAETYIPDEDALQVIKQRNDILLLLEQKNLQASLYHLFECLQDEKTSSKLTVELSQITDGMNVCFVVFANTFAEFDKVNNCFQWVWCGKHCVPM
jgi:hypothetical protein